MLAIETQLSSPEPNQYPHTHFQNQVICISTNKVYLTYSIVDVQLEVGHCSVPFQIFFAVSVNSHFPCPEPL